MIVDELYMALVFSSKAHARILSIDASEAMKCSGVRSCLTAKDVPGSNNTGLFGDELIFAADEVNTCYPFFYCMNKVMFSFTWSL